jgi:hypothetical protein
LLIKKINRKKWEVFDITDSSVDSWEPAFDTELWRRNRVLNLFVKKVKEEDAEGVNRIPPQPI